MNIPIVTALDHRYLGYLHVLHASLQKHSLKEEKLHVLFPSGDSAVEATVARNAHFVPHAVDIETLSAFPVHGRGSAANYLRLAIPSVFPEVDRVLYIDTDCMIRHPLPDVEIPEGVLLAAVPNQEYRHLHRLKLPERHGYFNSGVMLLALDIWRSSGFADALPAIAKERGAEFELWDQDLLNIAAKGNWHRLPRNWNATAEIYFGPAATYHHEAALDPTIVHFTGPGKPLDINPRTEHPFYEEFLTYATTRKIKPRDILTKIILPFVPKISGPAKRLLARATRELTHLESLAGKTFPPVLSELEKQTLTRLETLSVQQGPFSGLIYPEAVASGSALLPKLLGTYESELYPIIEEVINSRPSNIIDVGCAEGYYAAGFARALPEAKVAAYDISPLARKRCSALGIANNLSNLTIGERFALTALPKNSNGLLFVDIEGAEADLFLESPVRPDGWHVLVELHDFIDPDTSSLLIEYFEKSHDITIIPMAPPATKARALDLPMRDALVLVDETRPCTMEWLYAKPR